MARYAVCNKDIAGTIKGGKKYLMTDETKSSFNIINEKGNHCYCLKHGCAHISSVEGAEWSFVEDEEKMGHEYKVGDMVRIVSGGYEPTDNLRNGDVFKITKVEDSFVYGACDKGDNLAFFKHEIEPVATAAELTFSVDIPTEAMKEFADHCERAAAAMERIKEMIK